ncbi:hypothetical protein N7508_004844 [Penicillium antarcticum]|uniref:uncharacterized protein n=1 Tax=Penicillium antarcticum TaxID=416450 RepID=UPI0023A0C9EE|nr:uncharacterized protein N7508_004844 [Penicillium antarcticum]KAJ5305829.1 hypothetical protein N7508_004844 [Penicillium antarcticum]
MFYSHEIFLVLTSPEHGVATIWLVATLGSRSIARRLNRKAILEVDVPNACKVITNPDAPMALRLQGSLLYGVSRVYSQQCGYILLDTQTTHDNMFAQLKIIAGGGLDPTAGQTKPGNLILPYDPAFLPETGLPGLDVDLSILNGTFEDPSTQLSDLWLKSPNNSSSGVSPAGSLQIELPSEDMLGEETLIRLDDAYGSAQKKYVFGQIAGLGLGNDKSGLLQADFEFDEDGNLVELGLGGGSAQPGLKSTVGPARSEDPGMELGWDEDRLDTELPVFAGNENTMELDTQTGTANIFQEVEDRGQTEQMIDIPAVGARQIRRPKDITIDENTALRNATMAEWNNEYISNMARAMKQKLQNRQSTLAKKNAAFWVCGQGIGSVGVKLCMWNELHPLSLYSGERLFDAISGYPKHNGHKRAHDEDAEQGRRVRSKENEQAKRLSRANIDRLNMDVEMGRDAPSSLFDDHSSQMPWNITVSIQSSRNGYRYGSVSELSSQARNGSVGPKPRRRNRLTSASPLAGHDYRAGQERLSSTDILGDFGDDLDLTMYLEGELATDRETIGSITSRRNAASKRATLNLDRESLNFYDFIKSKLETSHEDEDEGSIRGSHGSTFSGTLSTKTGQTTFATLLPVSRTTRAVATQGLMNVLTLATKGVLDVHQGQYVDVSTDGLGVCYCYGEIILHLSGM